MASTIKVDNVQNQPGTNIIKKCGAAITVGVGSDTVTTAGSGALTVSGNAVKSNALQASDGGNLISQSGTDITLGASGDTINLASGASQSGFGRTGTVDWDTASIKTATFSAVSGNGYFANTTGGTFTMNLPAGVAGSIVSVVDYANTFDSNKLTIAPNGSQKIGSQNENADLATEGQSVTFIYVDDTQGWKNTMDSTSNVIGINPFIVATGGSPCSGAIVCTNYKVHTFTGPGTFCVTAAGTPAGSDTVDYMVVGGGAPGDNGAGCTQGGGGGGAGGFRESSGAASGCYTASPLGSGVAALPVSIQGYPIQVGAGGPATPSIFSTITSAGGGKGNGFIGVPGAAGGSGGGGGAQGGSGGGGNTPPVSPPQGNPGSPAPSPTVPGSGGGAGSAGSGTTAGSGVTTNITASPVVYGGGGANGAGPGGTGGPGGGGPRGVAGTVNTGGGGGGNGGPGSAIEAGGSGIVVIRYKFQ